ncbi:uncharacterized protein [Acropora muricata]|uniref:uncharacterized protein isoform X2 n=1 Tax=Acropora muricata TaxID=159855 RepID=UPI0034E45CF4
MMFSLTKRNDTKLASHSVSDEEAPETSEMVFNGIDLLALKAPPREPTRYATRLAGVLFTKEELTVGMIPPLNEKYNRQPLDPGRVSMMRKCISQKYSGKVATKCWGDIRRAVNQKCNDIRKKNVSGSSEHLQA